MRALAVAAVFLLATSARAADAPVAPEWPAIDELVEVDLLTPEKLKEQIVIDLENGAGSDRCPNKAWTGRATYLFPNGDELVYFGTGIYCAPVGYGRIQYSDGRSYVGQVNSFLESASAVLTQAQFRPAVRNGNGKLNSKGAASNIGSFQRGVFVGDRSQDQAFLKALDAAENSLPDRYAPMMTSAVAAFLALPAGGAAVAASAPTTAFKAGDSVAAVGAAAVAAITAAPTPVPAPSDNTGGSLFTAAPVAATGAVAATAYTGGGALALPAPLPSDYNDMAGMMGFTMPSEAAAAEAKQLPKEFNLKARNNGIFYGASCPKAGFLGLKPWRARVVFTETFSGRIVYDGVGFGCGPLGPGRIEFEDGSVYDGQVTTFTKSQMNPIGNFEPAIPSGFGKFTFPDGTVVEGTWARGELNGGPMTVTKRGGQPQAFVTGTLAQLRSGGMGAGSVAAMPSGAVGGTPGNAAMQGVAAAAAASMLSGTPTSAAPAGAAPFTPSAATPFAPAGGAGLPFTPAGMGGAVAAAGPGKLGPQPMLGNTGKYLCPFTEDGTVALWVDKAIKARMGGAIGGMVGAEVGKEVFKNIPMFGSMFGKMAGDKIGRETAIKMAGGWEFIKANSDQSFDSVHEYVAWLKANYAGTEHYNDVVAAIKELYPELKTMQF